MFLRIITLLREFRDGKLGSGPSAEWLLATRLHAVEHANMLEIERRRHTKTLVGVAVQGGW